MRMIRNKMVEARRAADRDSAEEYKARKTPMKKWEGEQLVYARDVDNAMVQDQHQVVVIGADVKGLYPNLVDVEPTCATRSSSRAKSSSTTSTSGRPSFTLLLI